MEQRKIRLDDFYQVELTHVKGLVSPDFFADAPHSHEHCELFIHLRGDLVIFVEQNRYHLSGGEIRVYRSGELHCGKIEAPEEMEWYQISIPATFFLQKRNRSLSAVLFAREAGEGNVFYSAAREQIRELLAEVFSLYGAENPLWEHYAESAVRRILCLLNEGQRNRPISSRQNHVLRRILDVINAEFGGISTVEELSRRTHYSVSYINRLFGDHMGMTPYRFLVAKKLNEAKKALLGGCSVTAACEYAGFNSYNNFITLFRKTFHRTPKQYSGEREKNGMREEVSYDPC